MKIGREKTFKKKDKKELLHLMYKIKFNANEIQKFIEQYEIMYNEEASTSISKKDQKLMKDCYNSANKVILTWGRARNNWE